MRVRRKTGASLVGPYTGPGYTGYTSLVAQTVKNLPANSGDVGSIPGSGKSPPEGNSNPLQYSCLGNSTEKPGGLQSLV